MTKKHFEAIAAILRNALPLTPDSSSSDYTFGYDVGRGAGVELVANELAEYFIQVNPNFDRAKFLEAAGCI